MSHVVTFDDKMLRDAMDYARCLVKKLEAMEEPTGRIEQALSLMEYVQSEIESEIAERFEARRGTEEAYRWLAWFHASAEAWRKSMNGTPRASEPCVRTADT